MEKKKRKRNLTTNNAVMAYLKRVQVKLEEPRRRFEIERSNAIVQMVRDHHLQPATVLAGAFEGSTDGKRNGMLIGRLQG